MATTLCPRCEQVVHRDRPRLEDRFNCRSCGEELEVVDTRPFEVDYVFEGYEWEEETVDEEGVWLSRTLR